MPKLNRRIYQRASRSFVSASVRIILTEKWSVRAVKRVFLEYARSIDASQSATIRSRCMMWLANLTLAPVRDLCLTDLAVLSGSSQTKSHPTCLSPASVSSV